MSVCERVCSVCACVRECSIRLYLPEFQSTEMVDKGCAVVDQAVKDSILAKYATANVHAP